MNYNVFLQDESLSKWNHLDLSEEHLNRIVDAFDNGNNSYFLGGKINAINRKCLIQIFEFSSRDNFAIDISDNYLYTNDPLGNSYISAQKLGRYGRDVTNDFLKGEFGYRKVENITKGVTKNVLLDLGLDVESNELIQLKKLHPKVVKIAKPLFKDKHYRSAILDTYIGLVNAVKVKASITDFDGVDLMHRAFSKDKPVLKLSDDGNEQKGYMFLFSGAVAAIRNEKAHKLIYPNDPQYVLEMLSLASYLFRLLDKAEVQKLI
jgi:uncharacterized protein (TIGR02391 family)